MSSPTKINGILPFLRPFNNALRITATKGNREAFEDFVEFLTERAELSVDELVSAIEAIEPPKKTTKPAATRVGKGIDQSKVESYAFRLNEVRGDFEAFKPIFAEFEGDKALSIATKKAIAMAVVPGERSYKSGKAALEAIEDYFKNLSRSQSALERNLRVKF